MVGGAGGGVEEEGLWGGEAGEEVEGREAGGGETRAVRPEASVEQIKYIL